MSTTGNWQLAPGCTSLQSVLNDQSAELNPRLIDPGLPSRCSISTISISISIIIPIPSPFTYQLQTAQSPSPFSNNNTHTHSFLTIAPVITPSHSHPTNKTDTPYRQPTTQTRLREKPRGVQGCNTTNNLRLRLSFKSKIDSITHSPTSTLILDLSATFIWKIISFFHLNHNTSHHRDIPSPPPSLVPPLPPIHYSLRPSLISSHHSPMFIKACA